HLGTHHCSYLFLGNYNLMAPPKNHFGFSNPAIWYLLLLQTHIFRPTLSQSNHYPQNHFPCCLSPPVLNYYKHSCLSTEPEQQIRTSRYFSCFCFFIVITA